MFERDFGGEYRREIAAITPTDGQMEEVLRNMRREKLGKPVRRLGRAAVAAAVVCAMAAVTAAAYFAGAFEVLLQQDEYAMLGMNEVYEEYAWPVEQTVTAANGDVLTVDRVAMDGKICTLFYSIRYQEPLMTAEELEEKWGGGSAYVGTRYNPSLTLFSGGEQVSEMCYQNSFEPQQYLADEHTLYVAWRFLLRRPLVEGETVQLRGERYGDRREDGTEPLLWSLTLDFTAHPAGGEHFELDTAFSLRLQGESTQVEAVALDRSPQGTLLTLRRATEGTDGCGVNFVLRDGDTGAYIPYAEVITSHQTDPEGYVDSVYELFGDVSGLRSLELIPTVRETGPSPQKVVSVDELPCTDSGNPDGGYAPASCRAENGQLIVEMRPVGAATGEYAMLGNGVYFLDEQGNPLFEDIFVEKFKNRSDGTITVVMTPSAGSYARDVEKVARIWFFVQRYEVQEGQRVSIPLEQHSELSN